MTSADVGIVAYNSVERLQRLLPLLVCNPEVGKIVVVDHGDDGSDSVARQHGVIVLSDRSNPGFAAGQNRAVAKTTAPFVLLVNPDLSPSPSALRHGIQFMLANPNAALVQGVIKSEVDGEPERSAGRSLGPIHLWGRLLHLRSLLLFKPVRILVRRVPALTDHVDRSADLPRKVEAVAATMVLVRRKAFDEVGGFNEEFFLYGEDLDLCMRLRSAGWEVWTLPQIWAVHASGESSNSRWNRELVWWEGTMRFACLHWSGTSFAIGVVASLLRAASLAMLRPTCARQAFRRLVLEPISRRRDRS